MNRIGFLLRLPRFVAYYLGELVLSSLRVALDVLRIEPRYRPAVVAYPLAPDLSDGEVAAIANLVSLTPGTISLDVSDDRTTLYLHVMDAGGDIDGVRRGVKQGIEREVRRLTRGNPAGRGAGAG